MGRSLHTPRAQHPTPAVFFDRDGTLNVEKNYLYRFADWEWIPGAQDSIKLLRSAGFMVVVVSNQAGIARAMYLPGDVDELHAQVQKDLQRGGTLIDAFYYCPHHPDFDASCSCRKPAPGMLMQSAQDLNIDLAASWMIGDKAIDVQAGLAAGVKSLLVETGYGTKDRHQLDSGVLVFASVVEAAVHVQSQATAFTCNA